MNFGRWIGLCSLVLAGYVLWQIRYLLLIIFCAIVFATALNRVVHFWQKQGIPRQWALFITLLLTLAGISGFIWSVVPPFIEQLQTLVQLLPKIVARVEQFLITSEQQFPTWLPSPLNLGEWLDRLQPLSSRLLSNFFTLFQLSLGVLLQLLLLFLLTGMLLVNPQGYRRTFLQLFPSFYRRRADQVLTQSEKILGNWLTGISVSCVFIALSSGLGLWVLQIPLVLTHALMAGILNFIPNIGPTISVVFPVMVALLDAPWKIIAILIWYLVVQNVETYWVTPTIMAKQVSLLPAVTLAAQFFFATSFGLLGLLLALPLTVVAKTWLEEVLFKDILDNMKRQTS